jgi:prepilin-type N-terminal cleavage/methylation domain-containing protein
MKPWNGKLGNQAGFSLLEILMAILLLCISFVGLTAYSGSQRKALYKSSDLTEASNTALTVLEKAKVPLSDSAAFRAKYNALTKPATVQSTYKGKKTTYTTSTTLSRITGTSNLIKAQVKVTWAGGHVYNIGMLLVQP